MQNRIYQFQETGEIIRISNHRNPELRDHWDQSVLGYIEMFTGGEHGLDWEEYVEYVNGKTYRAVIFFNKHNVNVANYILYQDKQKKIDLFITYLSDLPDDVKIRNMKKIITGIKFE
ncbi:hypothetical protein H8B06_10455 [Sphingobacterium sp. DN00404]|uniref:Uncharacterized protein n=1 Tax=Sphingobacterium micropteri TaxID=2763501 RepID=A0ABR7YPP6_9SPHI|nr:hypothetical protein [Sphingobacterium micropteri]MBD1433249.1 hypothetical protein [Sphingobacterium micropteri]